MNDIDHLTELVEGLIKNQLSAIKSSDNMAKAIEAIAKITKALHKRITALELKGKN